MHLTQDYNNHYEMIVLKQGMVEDKHLFENGIYLFCIPTFSYFILLRGLDRKIAREKFRGKIFGKIFPRTKQSRGLFSFLCFENKFPRTRKVKKNKYLIY